MVLGTGLQMAEMRCHVLCRAGATWLCHLAAGPEDGPHLVVSCPDAGLSPSIPHAVGSRDIRNAPRWGTQSPRGQTEIELCSLRAVTPQYINAQHGAGSSSPRDCIPSEADVQQHCARPQRVNKQFPLLTARRLFTIDCGRIRGEKQRDKKAAELAPPA